MTRLQALAAGCFVVQAGTAFVLGAGGATDLLGPYAFLGLGALNAMLGAGLLVLPSIKSSATIVRPPGDIEPPRG